MRATLTTNGLKRWSCKSKDLPSIESIKSLHIYDFDNTLFSSPHPNPQLWHPPVIGMLQNSDLLTTGGWWHNKDILAATGKGLEEEEPLAWAGHWNETVVELVETSIAEPGVLTVLLTGRGEAKFADLINRMLDAKELDFDMVVLKPEIGPQRQQFSSTSNYKTAFFQDLVLTYKIAEEIKVYDDRPKHVKHFRDWLEMFNRQYRAARASDTVPSERDSQIRAEVIHVVELKTTLDPQTEVNVIQAAISKHNQTVRENGPNPFRAASRYYKITEHFLYFGYLITQEDAARLIALCNAPLNLVDSGEIKYMASSILIAPFYPRKETLDAVGGRGNRVTWQVNGVAKFEERIWAARVTPLSDTPTHTQDETPMVVLAIRKGSRQIDAQKIKNWSQVKEDKQVIFETVVGDKSMLKIEETDESVFNDIKQSRSRGRHQNGQISAKRKYGQDFNGFRVKESVDANSTNTWARVVSDNNNQRQGSPKPSQKQIQQLGARRAKSHAQFNNNAPFQPAASANSASKRNGANKSATSRSVAKNGYKSLDEVNGEGTSDHQNGSAVATAAGPVVMDY